MDLISTNISTFLTQPSDSASRECFLKNFGERICVEIFYYHHSPQNKMPGTLLARSFGHPYGFPTSPSQFVLYWDRFFSKSIEPRFFGKLTIYLEVTLHAKFAEVVECPPCHIHTDTPNQTHRVLRKVGGKAPGKFKICILSFVEEEVSPSKSSSALETNSTDGNFPNDFQFQRTIVHLFLRCEQSRHILPEVKRFVKE